MKILIAGGAGFIGSTVASACLDAGHSVVLVDNLVTGRREFVQGRPFYEGDIADRAVIDRVFADHPDIGLAVHAAALVVVPESVADPLRYYRENVAKSVEFLDHVSRHGCRRIVFSSSASIYATTADLTVDEFSPLRPLSPYARSKAMVESVLADVAAAGQLRAVSLRYFNPIGADPMMRSGLQLADLTHALGRIISAARTGRPFQVTGVDYPTRDGSGLRDFVHVWDLAQAHVEAVNRFDGLVDASQPHVAINLGTGTGTTVLELVRAYQDVTGVEVEVEIAGRRPGDSAGSVADGRLAEVLLDWRARRSLHSGIADTLSWMERRGALLGIA